MFYGVYKMLEQYLRRIYWVVLCPISLRGIRQTSVSFWGLLLKMALTESHTILTIHLVFVTIASLKDKSISCIHALRQTIGFPSCCVVTQALFTFDYA